MTKSQLLCQLSYAAACKLLTGTFMIASKNRPDTDPCDASDAALWAAAANAADDNIYSICTSCPWSMAGGGVCRVCGARQKSINET